MRERWWVAPGAGAALGLWARRSVPAWMEACARAQALSTDRDSAAVRLLGPAGALLVKWRRPSRAKGWKHALRPSRERREALGLLAARAIGLDVPAPLLVGERRTTLGRLVGSVLVRPWVEGLEPADLLLARAGGAALLAPLARALRAWHDAGWRHGDAWPKNLLLAPDGSRALPVGAPKAHVVGAGPRLDRARRRDLARLAAGLSVLEPTLDPLRFLPAYLEGPGLCDLASLERAVRPLLARVLAKRAEDVRSRPAREPHGPPLPVPLPDDAARVRRRERPLA